MAFCYDHPRPAVTVDILVFTVVDDTLKILLIRRGEPPFEDSWALPGGFVEINESLRRAAWRELREETGVKAAFLEQLGAFGRPGRDPRGRVITIAYYALVPADRLDIRSGSDAADARLFALENLPNLAFDHARIIGLGLDRLGQRIEDPVIALQLMPREFTLPELQRVHELVLGRLLDKRNFRKRISASGLLEATGNQRRSGAHRPAALYRVRDPSAVPHR